MKRTITTVIKEFNEQGKIIKETSTNEIQEDANPIINIPYTHVNWDTWKPNCGSGSTGTYIPDKSIISIY